MARLLRTVLFLSLFPPLCAAADWPAYRRDVRRSGWTAEQLDVKRLHQAWVYRSPAPLQPAWAGPARWDAYAGLRGLSDMRAYDKALHAIVVGDAVYFGSSLDDAVHCLDLETGRPRWLAFADAPIRTPSVFAGGRLFFGSDDGCVYCVEAATGKRVWRFKPPVDEPLILNNGRFISTCPCRTGVTVADGVAYCAFSLLPWKPSYLCALDAATGRPEGQGRFVRKVESGTFEAPLVVSATHIVALQGRVPPAVFSRDDGRMQQGLSGGGGSFAGLLGDAMLLHGPGNKTGWLTLSALDRKGRPKTFRGELAAAVAADAVYTLGRQGVAKRDAKSWRPLWQTRFSPGYDIIVAGNHVFVGGEDEVAALDAATGKHVWSAPVHGRARGLAAAGGCLLVSTDAGAIHCFRPASAAPTRQPSREEPPQYNPRIKPLPGIEDHSLIGRWRFTSGMFAAAKRRGVKDAGRHVRDEAGGAHGKIFGDVQMRRVGGVEALVFDGRANSVLIAADHRKVKLPQREITAEAWLRVDEPRRWGGIIGVMQDNGSHERGWLLGYNGRRFSFAVNATGGANRLTYLTAKTEFQPGQWYHVVGVYDGKTQRVYVNGRLEQTSDEQQGDIHYPSQAFFEIGAYHDKDENFRLAGQVHEVSVYRRALTAEEVRARHKAKRGEFPTPVRLALGPYARFVTPGSAVVRWETATPSPTILDYRLGHTARRVGDDAKKTRHQATLTGLKYHRLYHYSITTMTGGQTRQTAEFELDTHFNFSTPLAARGERPSPLADTAAAILAQSGVDRGVCLVLDCGDGQLALELARRSTLTIIGLETDRDKVAAARRVLSEAGVYGRVTVRHAASLKRLPFIGGFANLIVSARPLAGGPLPPRPKEIARLLRPDGGTLLLQRENGTWFISRRGPLAGAGAWTHLYGDADNSGFGGETLGQASGAGDLALQWIGRPGPRFQPDRNGRKPSPLSAGGRLYVQGLRRLIALDAYNGVVLWSLEVPPLGRFNMPRDCSNWCADKSHLYVAIRGRCWRIDGRTGEVLRTDAIHDPVNRATTNKRWDYDWGYVARHGNLLLGSAVKQGAAYTNFWGKANDGWYDARSGPPTYKVASDHVFARNASGGRRIWTHSDGVIINSTITAAEGKLFFVCCRDPAVTAAATRRIGSPRLWQDSFLVALDAASGKKLWERKLNITPATVAVYMVHGGGKLLIGGSSNKRYDLSAFSAADGSPQWTAQCGWPGGAGDHGKALSRPVIVGGRVYLRPGVFELKTGLRVNQKMPPGGCGTYAAAAHCFIYRNSETTLWDPRSNRTSAWRRLRPGCWLSTIPAGGLLLSPEAGGGCSCGKWLETSVGFKPRRPVANGPSP